MWHADDGDLALLPSGLRGSYRWLECPEATFDDVLEAAPDLVLGRWIAITSFDSGPLQPTAEETARGWRTESGIALSPRIECLDELPFDQFDEWYIFTEPPALPSLEVFVNNCTFQLSRSQYGGTDYLGASRLQSLLTEWQEWFWYQVEQLEPAAYMAQGDRLILVLREPAIFQRVFDALQSIFGKQ